MRMANDLDVPLLAKDDIKELLFERLPQRDREWSRVQGKMAIAMMFAGARELLLNDSPVIIESLFHPEYARADILGLIKATNADVFEVKCHVAHEQRQSRWRERSSSARHAGHMDNPDAELVNADAEVPLFPESSVIIDTGAPVSEYEERYAEIMQRIKSWMKEGDNETTN
jgi:predicted kinase